MANKKYIWKLKIICSILSWRWSLLLCSSLWPATIPVVSTLQPFLGDLPKLAISKIRMHCCKGGWKKIMKTLLQLTQFLTKWSGPGYYFVISGILLLPKITKTAIIFWIWFREQYYVITCNCIINGLSPLCNTVWIQLLSTHLQLWFNHKNKNQCNKNSSVTMWRTVVQ